MSANYVLVRISEKELTQKLLKFYRHVKKSWSNLITLISKHTKITNDIYKQFQTNENKSNHMEADILNETIWSISRNQPVANHLRFAVSIIYSISDLERMADYVMNSINIIKNSNFNEEVLDIIKDAYKLSYDCMNNLLKTLTTKDKIKIDAALAYKLANKALNDYRIKHKDITKRLSKVIFDKNTPKQIDEILSSVSIIIKYSERNIDHAVNIIENFIYVRESNYFVNKHSNKTLDFDNLNLNKQETLTKKKRKTK